MLFADEENHHQREFIAAWPANGEKAEVLADKLQKLIRRMEVFEPAYGEIRPILAMRAFRPSDPGPILAMSVEELGSLIDRRARFDPPSLPEPVSKDGYHIVFGPDRSGHDVCRLWVGMKGGQHRAGAWDSLDLEPHPLSPIWRSIDVALLIFDALIDVFDCSCVSASAFISKAGGGTRRPWITWVSNEVDPAVAPYPFPFINASPAVQETDYRTGRMSLWP